MDSRLPKVFEMADHSRRHVVLDGDGGRAVLARVAVIVGSILATTVVGCGGIKYIPVSGQVKLDGKSVAECAVLFVPVAGGPAASASTDAEGRFQLATTNHPGVVAGDYCVTVTKQNVTDLFDKTTGDHRLRVKWLTPEKYSRPETSGFRKTVSDQEHEFVFELSSK
jgi:hypothetical protein